MSHIDKHADPDFEVEFAERLVNLLERAAASGHPPDQVAGAALAALLAFATRRGPAEQIAGELAALAECLRDAGAAERGAPH